MRRDTTTRDRHRATIARRAEPCHICGQAIDYTLPHLDPLSYVVDHLVPLARGGTDTISNKSAAHRACNARKAARPYAPILRRPADGLQRPVQEGVRLPSCPETEPGMQATGRESPEYSRGLSKR